LIGEFALQPVELCVGEHRAVRPGIDQRTGRPRRIVEQRLVPFGGGIVGVDRAGRRLERAEAVIVVERIEQRQMQDRRQRGVLIESHGRTGHGVVEALRPAIRPRHDFHAVRP
jgi:hypothetical protein